MKLFLFFLILGAGTSLPTFIPEWRNLEMVLVLAMLLASALAGSLHLSSYWKHHRSLLEIGLRTVGIIFFMDFTQPFFIHLFG